MTTRMVTEILDPLILELSSASDVIILTELIASIVCALSRITVSVMRNSISNKNRGDTKHAIYVYLPMNKLSRQRYWNLKYQLSFLVGRSTREKIEKEKRSSCSLSIFDANDRNISYYLYVSSEIVRIITRVHFILFFELRDLF